MGQIESDLLMKIKRLHETLWEGRAPEPAIRRWLENFNAARTPGYDEKALALFILSNFLYFGSRQIRAMLKAVYRDLYRYPIIEELRRANNDTNDSSVLERLYEIRLQNTRFLGMGNPAESGCHLLYFFRQENELPKQLFINSHQLFERRNGARALRKPKPGRLVFLDDFCGSGDQGIEYSRSVLQEVKGICPDIMAEYYVLFATSHGVDRLRRESDFDAVKAIHVLDESFRLFSSTSRYFSNAPSSVDKAACESMCQNYGEKLLGQAHALGYNDGQLLIGFHHNIPDNSIPIIWFDDPAANWIPMFRRYTKKLGW